MIDDGAAQVTLKRLARQIDRSPRDAKVSLIGSQVVTEGSLTGRMLDVPATVSNIKKAIDHPVGLGLEAELVTHDVVPVVRDAQAAADQLSAILSGPVRLTLSEQAWNETGKTAVGMLLSPIQQEREWTLDTAALAAMVSTRQSQGADGQATLSVVIDDAKLTAFLKELAPQIRTQTTRCPLQL